MTEQVIAEPCGRDAKTTPGGVSVFAAQTEDMRMESGPRMGDPIT